MNDYSHNVRIIGKCSLCGGRVVLPITYMSTIPPKPRCESCGAIAAEPELPTIPMKPLSPWRRNDQWHNPYDRHTPRYMNQWRSLFC